MRTVREQLDLYLEDGWPLIVLYTVWPRAARVLDPFVGRPPRRVLRNVVLWAAWLFAMREWIGPRAKAASERRDREYQEFAARLGRKPTRDEVVEEYVRRRAASRRSARARWERRRAPGR